MDRAGWNVSPAPSVQNRGRPFHPFEGMQLRAAGDVMVMTQIGEGAVSEMPGIIVGVDGSAHSQGAVAWAMSEAVSRRVPLTALSVYQRKAVTYSEGDMNLDQAVEEVRALVDKAAGHRLGRAPAVTVGVIVGSPADELIGASRDADLLVVGSRGSGGLGRRGLGSVSSRVADEACCPVVIISQSSSTRLTARSAA